MNAPAQGGLAGPPAFTDDDLGNNFWGLRPLTDSEGRLKGIVRGELERLHAGSGGGGGGDAFDRANFLPGNWGPGSDQKGGAGGGGGGGLHIQALGRIVFGDGGLMRSNGGAGARGEQNPSNRNSIGATGGSGSGGHIVLESATQIDFTRGGTVIGLRDRVEALGAEGTRRIGSGSDDVAQGGRGGGGLIQLHVPDPLNPIGTDENASIRVPLAAAGAEDPLDEIVSPQPVVLIPTFGPRSQALSSWIPIAGADQGQQGGTDLVRFRFDGTDAGGFIETVDGAVVENEPLLEGVLGEAARIDVSGTTLILDRTALLFRDDGEEPPNDLYLRTPALLEGYLVRLETPFPSEIRRDFPVTSARYDEGRPIAPDERLFLTIAPRGGETLADLEARGATSYRLIPRFFTTIVDGRRDVLPEGSSVRILFEATGADPLGRPDEDSILVPPTPDVSRFNDLDPGALRFFRFRVDFRLVGQGELLPADVRPPALEMLKLPFVF